MASREVNITNEWLRVHMANVQMHHGAQMAKYPHVINNESHHGIVPDLINEILRLRGEPVIEFEWASFPEFVKQD